MAEQRRKSKAVYNLAKFMAPESELQFRADKGSGPGGQNRNKRETRARVAWDFERSDSLNPAQKNRLRTFSELKKRLNADGMIEFVAEDSRSQLLNRETAMMRLQAFVNQAFRPVKKRKKTLVPKREKEARLADKKRRAEKKKDRGKRAKNQA